MLLFFSSSLPLSSLHKIQTSGIKLILISINPSKYVNRIVCLRTLGHYKHMDWVINDDFHVKSITLIKYKTGYFKNRKASALWTTAKDHQRNKSLYFFWGLVAPQSVTSGTIPGKLPVWTNYILHPESYNIQHIRLLTFGKRNGPDCYSAWLAIRRLQVSFPASLPLTSRWCLKQGT